MFQEFSQDFCKIILQFLGEVPINAKFFRIFQSFFIVYIFEHFLGVFEKLFQNFPIFFEISLNFEQFFHSLTDFPQFFFFEN